MDQAGRQIKHEHGKSARKIKKENQKEGKRIYLASRAGSALSGRPAWDQAGTPTGPTDQSPSPGTAESRGGVGRETAITRAQPDHKP